MNAYTGIIVGALIALPINLWLFHSKDFAIGMSAGWITAAVFMWALR